MPAKAGARGPKSARWRCRRLHVLFSFAKINHPTFIPSAMLAARKAGVPMAALNFLKGVNQGATVTLDGERMVLGRNADCQVVLDEPAVSREHAVIRKIQGKFYIEDMKSRNRTFVNNQEISARTL